MTPTPRTDASFTTVVNNYAYVPIELCRKLERELTTQQATREAEVKRLIGDLSESDRMREFFEKGMDETAKERDQLRKVCDTLAFAYHDETGYFTDDYNSLPHVKERN